VLTVITPPGGVIAEALGINNLGHVVGRNFTCDIIDGNCVNGRTRAFIYRNGAFQVLGTLGGRDSLAFDINDSEQVTGWSHATLPNGDEHAFIFQNGTFEDINTIIGTTSSSGSSINASGQIAGRAGSNTSNRGAFLYTNGATQFFELQGSAEDVNNSGQVVGVFGGNDDGSGRAFLFSGGVRQDLGTLSLQHNFSHAFAINNVGRVVGISSQSFFTREDERAFVHANGMMQDLNSLIPAGSGWVLTVAVDINDAGQIVGNGKFNGQDRAFLLTPTEPTLLTDVSTNKVIALESISFLAGPFRLTTPHNLSTDQRTRITLLTRNVEMIAGETVAPPFVEAEDAQHNVFVLPVEFVGKIPGANWLTQIVVRLPDELTAGGNLQVSVLFRGRRSNRGEITILQNAVP
jgi:probable HAF family extracellular repeat protein